jgi:hypothetical protein
MTHNGLVAGGGRLTDWISLGVLAASVPGDAVVKRSRRQAGARGGRMESSRRM